jgi:hypothetical protein
MVQSVPFTAIKAASDESVYKINHWQLTIDNYQAQGEAAHWSIVNKKSGLGSMTICGRTPQLG